MVLLNIFGVERDIDINATEKDIAKLEAPLGEHEHGWFDSCIGGAKLHSRAFLPPQGKEIKAVVIFMHGITGNSGEGFELSDGRKTVVALIHRVFNEAGIALHCFDHYGHGYSEGTRFFVPSYQENLQDYINFVQMVDKKYKGEMPIFLMGCSYGGTLTIHASRKFQDNPSLGPRKFGGALLFCPAVTTELPPYPVYLLLRYVLAPLYPKWTPFFMPNPISADRVWKDPEVLKLRTDPHLKEMNVCGTGEPFCLGTALSIVQSMEDTISKSLPGFTVPFFLAHGTQDYGVTIEGSELLCRTVDTPAEDREVHFIEGGYHDLFSLKESPVYLKMAVAWMEKRITK